MTNLMQYVVGGVLLTLLPTYLSGLKQFVPIVYGAVIILMMAVEPTGIYGRWLRVKRYLKVWPL